MYTENSKISLSLMLLKIVAPFISPLNELHALSFYKPLEHSYSDLSILIGHLYPVCLSCATLYTFCDCPCDWSGPQTNVDHAVEQLPL